MANIPWVCCKRKGETRKRCFVYLHGEELKEENPSDPTSLHVTPRCSCDGESPEAPNLYCEYAFRPRSHISVKANGNPSAQLDFTRDAVQLSPGQVFHLESANDKQENAEYFASLYPYRQTSRCFPYLSSQAFIGIPVQKPFEKGTTIPERKSRKTRNYRVEIRDRVERK